MDLDFNILLIPCLIVGLIIGYLSIEIKEFVWNGFWFGVAVSISCGCWITHFEAISKFEFLILTLILSFFVGLFGVFVALIGNTVRVCVF